MTAIPTLGFPSQYDAIVALYQDGISIADILAITKCSVNSAYRAITDYKAKHGIRNQPLRKQIAIAPPVEANYDRLARERGIWSLSDNDKRQAFHAKAVKAAREARLANHE